jgi:integrase
MRPRKTQGRVLGPYAYRKGWRIIVVERDGTRHPSVHPSEERAREVAVELRRQLAVEEVTVSAAIDMYAEHLRERGRKENGVNRGVQHLRNMMTDSGAALVDVTPARALALYDDLRKRINPRTKKPLAVDTQRNALNECGMFGRWAVKRKLIAANPFEEIESKGKRKHGKVQLRLDEARKLGDVAVDAALSGDRGALVVALLLMTGFRATESATLEARDVDDNGRLLWTDGKTGKRRMATPEVLIDVLRVVAADGGSLWPKSDRFWVYRQVRKWCKRAGVTVVTPQGLRGTHSTLAQEHGATSHVVAAALGHGLAVNQRAYTLEGTSAQAAAKRAQKLLKG